MSLHLELQGLWGKRASSCKSDSERSPPCVRDPLESFSSGAFKVVMLGERLLRAAPAEYQLLAVAAAVGVCRHL